MGIRPLDREQFGRVGVQLHRRLLRGLLSRLVLRVLAADHPVRPVEHPVPVLVGNAQELGDDDQRELGGHVGDEVGGALFDDRVDDQVGGGVDPVVELVDHLRGEPLVDQPAIPGVEGWVHVEHQQLLLREVVVGQVPDEGGLLGRREVLVVSVHLGAIGMGGHRPEPGAVGLLLPPHRGVLPQEGEPVVGYPVGERLRIGQIDVVETDGFDVDGCVGHVGCTLQMIGHPVRFVGSYVRTGAVSTIPGRGAGLGLRGEACPRSSGPGREAGSRTRPRPNRAT